MRVEYDIALSLPYSTSRIFCFAKNSRLFNVVSRCTAKRHFQYFQKLRFLTILEIL